MTPLLQVVHQAARYLKEKGIERPKRSAEEVIAAALGLRRIDLFLMYDRPLVEEELQKCRYYLRRRGAHEPIQYIEEQVDFFGVELQVCPQVLIPRPETEQLVEMISRILETQELAGKVLFDVATGSGCIGIALKKRFPDLQVVLSDISQEALTVAKENARRNAVEVSWLQGDLLTPFIGRKADFIVSNPPYIAEREYAKLAPNVRNFEPPQALVGGKTGLEAYQKLANQLKNSLNPSAKVWLEIGASQAEAILELFAGEGSIIKDLSGRDRFFFLETDPLS